MHFLSFSLSASVVALRNAAGCGEKRVNIVSEYLVRDLWRNQKKQLIFKLQS